MRNEFDFFLGLNLLEQVFPTVKAIDFNVAMRDRCSR